ncbi:MAG TPA: hypothetical protein VFA32_00480 [Dehalococcoidia bacterium]|jgi:hypothetical protein|nr:hypothetical protein [Dehalococcoidia bacterium]
MARSKKKTQKTPQGYEILIPARKDFFENLRKASEPEEAPEEERESSDRPEKD